MTERILSLTQVVEEGIVPLSKSRLYEIAQTEPDSPFHKRSGKWMTVESDLLKWVRSGATGKKKLGGGEPMPRSTHARRGSLLERVREIRSEAA